MNLLHHRRLQNAPELKWSGWMLKLDRQHLTSVTQNTLRSHAAEFEASIEGCVHCYVVLINLGRLSVVCNAVLLRDHSSLLDVAQSIGYKAVAC